MTMEKLGLDTVIGHNDDVVTRELSGNIMLLAMGEGKIHELDDVGTDIWNRCTEPACVRDIVDGIVQDYDIERPVAERDVMAFVSKLLGLGLLAMK
jgi:hypothetical protein